MADSNEPIHVAKEDARAGSTPHVTRYVLPISLVLVIAIFAFLVCCADTGFAISLLGRLAISESASYVSKRSLGRPFPMIGFS